MKPGRQLVAQAEVWGEPHKLIERLRGLPLLEGNPPAKEPLA